LSGYRLNPSANPAARTSPGVGYVQLDAMTGCSRGEREPAAIGMGVYWAEALVAHHRATLGSSVGRASAQ
jgi:hypothetical protein